MNLATLKEHREALAEKFGASANIAYANVRQTMFSIARFYGGATIEGRHFVYNPTDDSLIRDDVLKFLAKKAKESP